MILLLQFVDTGYYHSLLLTMKDELYVCGYSGHGQVIVVESRLLGDCWFVPFLRYGRP